MLNSPKVLALREDLNRAAMTLSTSDYDVSDKELRDEVCSVVDDLKAAGWPPERALMSELDQIDAVPAAEPEQMNVRVSLPGNGGSE